MTNNTNNKQIMAIPISRNELNSIVNQFNGIKKSMAGKITEGLEYATTDDFENKLDQNVVKFKKTIKIVGTVATIALLVLPSDGPVGEIASFLATSTFVKAVDKLADSIKDVYKSSKKIYASSIKQDGSLNISSIADANTIENVSNLNKNFKNIKGSIAEIGENFSSMRRR